MRNALEHAPTLLRAEGLFKSYFRGAEVPVLRGVDLEVAAGEFVVVLGASGSGKSTLLHLLGAIDVPDSGSIFWNGERIDNKPARARDRYRNEVVGFVFQFYHLLPELNAVENVMLPALVQHGLFGYWSKRNQLRRRAEEMLERVNLSHRNTHRPSEMSGGEMQRAAIARALMSEPKLLLADEPTGNLDPQSGESVFDLLASLNRDAGVTIVMVTHNHELAKRADRIANLVQGRLDSLPARPPELTAVA